MGFCFTVAPDWCLGVKYKDFFDQCWVCQICSLFLPSFICSWLIVMWQQETCLFVPVMWQSWEISGLLAWLRIVTMTLTEWVSFLRAGICSFILTLATEVNAQSFSVGVTFVSVFCFCYCYTTCNVSQHLSSLSSFWWWSFGGPVLVSHLYQPRLM